MPEQTDRMRRAVVCAGAAAAACPWSGLQAQPRPVLDGYWLGEITHRGEQATMALKFATQADGTIRAWMSITPMFVRDFPISSPVWDGHTLRFATAALTYDPAAQTLSGVVPERLAPFYKLRVVYRKVEHFALPLRPPIAAPERAPVWTVDTGAQVWSDISAGDRAFFVGNDAGVLHALAAEDGRVHWRARFSAGLRAAPMLHDGRLYQRVDDGSLVCLNAADGRTVWIRPVEGNVPKRAPAGEPDPRFMPRTAAPVIHGDLLVLGTFGGEVLALNAGDGALRWRARFDDSIAAAPFVFGSDVYVGVFNGEVAALDARTGMRKWRFDARGAVTSSPVRVGDTVIAGSRAYDLWGLDAAGGAVKWNRYVWFSWIESTPAVRDGVAYVGSSDGAKLFALDPASGRLHWQADIRGQSRGYAGRIARQRAGGHAHLEGRAASQRAGAGTGPRQRPRVVAARGLARRDRRARRAGFGCGDGRSRRGCDDRRQGDGVRRELTSAAGCEDRTMTFDEPRTLVSADGLRIAYRIASPPDGDRGAPAVLLVHGLASNLTRFCEFVEFTTLRRSHTLIRVDLRGHGQSVSRVPGRLDRWCEDIAAILAQENAARVVLVGHSLGAQVALHFAHRHRPQVAGLVLIDPVFRQALKGDLAWYARFGWAFRLAAWAVRAANALGLRRADPLPPLDLRDLDARAREALASPAAEAEFIRQYSSARADLRHVHLAQYLQDLIELFRPLPKLEALDMPVLLLMSSGATFADASRTARVIARFPRATTQAIDCHHWPLTERPVEVRQQIEKCCAELT